MEMHDIQRGAFVDRPNRFIAHVSLDGDIATCHMPNPGRMWELLFPGVTVYVRPATNPKRRTAYDVVGIERDGIDLAAEWHAIVNPMTFFYATDWKDAKAKCMNGDVTAQ